MKNLFKSIFLAAILLTGCSNTTSNIIPQQVTQNTYLSSVFKTETSTTETKRDNIVTYESFYNDLYVHYIDVGQGDSTFIELPNQETVLIDAGDSDHGDTVCNYIQNLGYKEINYLIATHPHADHIGAMDDVMNNFEVDNLYLTKAETDSSTFKKMMSTANKNNIPINYVSPDKDILNENNLLIDVLAPYDFKEDTDLNNTSIVIKLTYGQNSFLFMGDAEIDEEKTITENVSADVIKLGHHGSSTSTSPEFLEKVSPKYAIVSCGKNNKYGHPHKETLTKLNIYGVPFLRTDKDGNIVIKSDSQNIFIETLLNNENIMETTQQQTEILYIGNKNSKKLHLATCESVEKMSKKNKEEIHDLQKAIDEGYVPCSICNPW